MYSEMSAMYTLVFSMQSTSRICSSILLYLPPNQASRSTAMFDGFEDLLCALSPQGREYCASCILTSSSCDYLTSVRLIETYSRHLQLIQVAVFLNSVAKEIVIISATSNSKRTTGSSCISDADSHGFKSKDPWCCTNKRNA